ncbi:MAG: cycloartenol synthase [Verrucomicrobia bacterium]|nr:cycloartenol synthase [Verrucomicrobiota bacterium]
MKIPTYFAFVFALSALVYPLVGSSNQSLKLEIERSLDKGLEWLIQEQNITDGYWGSPQYPALTALVLRATLGHPSEKEIQKFKDQVSLGYQFLRSKVQSDGGIYGKGLASYNTSISLMAFLQLNEPSDEQIIRSARKFLVNQQSDFDQKGKPDNLFDGGIGYGSTWAHSDLSNTHLAMEALYYAKKKLKKKEEDQADLDWEAAIQFVSKCQNLPSSNPQDWVSSHPEDQGGFVYFPGHSMAEDRIDENGSKSLRSYGSMSYAGLLSFIYAEMDASDPRVIAVKDWLSQNYQIDENPGMGKQGLFYYYHTMSKALTLAGVDQIQAKGQGAKDWKTELTVALLDSQNNDGFWVNESGRWWEKDPVLVSCYAMLALERIYYAL